MAALRENSRHVPIADQTLHQYSCRYGNINHCNFSHLNLGCKSPNTQGPERTGSPESKNTVRYDSAHHKVPRQNRSNPAVFTAETTRGEYVSEGRLERAMGFEPTTPTLARLCSTPELRPHPTSRGGFAFPVEGGVLCPIRPAGKPFHHPAPAPDCMAHLPACAIHGLCPDQTNHT